MNDWQSVMDDATAIAEAHGLEFYELRNAWGQRAVEEDRDFYEGHGVTASDGNHFLYSGIKSRKDEVEALASKLGSDKAERTCIVNSIAEASGQAPELVLQQLREFFAPVEEVSS